MWKGRIEAETARVMLDFSQSLDMDWRLAESDITGSVAHAKMLEKIGVLSHDESLAIENGLLEIRDEIRSGNFEPKIELEDVHMNIESRLTEKLGDIGAKLHTGRSRNDQIATTVRLYLRERFAEIARNMLTLLEALADRAERHASIIVPGYTHLQQAQPITMGHYWLAHFEAFSRDFKRLSAATDASGECPLGAGALAGSTLALDREFTADLLGFRAPTKNSLDTVASRDYIADYHHFASLFGVHVSRLAEDFVIYSSQEFGWLVLSDAFCTGSSMMPQKRNPDAAELLRGKTGQLIGHMLDLLITLKGTPMTYDRDFQEDKRGLFSSIDTVLMMLSVLNPLIAGAEVDEKRARASLERGNGCALATDVAEYLVANKVPFREAHHKVGRLVKFCIDNDKHLEELSLSEWNEHIPEVREDIFKIMSLEASVASRRTFGGTSPECVQIQVKAAKEIISDLKTKISPPDEEPSKPKKSEKLIQKVETFSLPLEPSNELIGYFDGASRGNPGKAGAGAWISDGSKEIWNSAVPLGEKTNNEAEYSALITLLSEFKRRGAKVAAVRGDSKLVIEQMSGRWKVKEPRLQELHSEAKTISHGMTISYKWVAREQNSRADELSNEAIDGK